MNDGEAERGKWMSWQPVDNKDMSSDSSIDDKSEIEIPENGESAADISPLSDTVSRALVSLV